MSDAGTSISLSEAARRAGLPQATLEHWVSERVLSVDDGRWTPALAAQARIVARMLDRGYSLRQVRSAVRDGRLAFGSAEDLLPAAERRHTREQVAEEVGIDAELVERVMALLGLPVASTGRFSDADVEVLHRLKRVLDGGFPLIALLQLVRVYAQSMRRIAEAEVRLFHLFVHEPMIEDGVPAPEMAERMGELTRQLLPEIAPVSDYLHGRYLRHYLEQDVIGHMETGLGGDSAVPGEVSMTFGFIDLAGFTRFTQEAGDAEALDYVERFVERVESTLPSEATIVKTIGDEVMVVCPDPLLLIDWAVGFIDLFQERPRPHIGLHYGRAVYRDGDYFGADVNLAHRIAARALAGEVLATSDLLDQTGSPRGLELESLGEVALKGFSEPIELYLARRSA
ncbi:MAG TPA: adenylate cyclase regulatory domain-containing protein [Solirubrobacterales bacterium]|nr:adenylate cyclase regulatory domain-containing protein [Solirubrobacterales bacterium]